MMKNTVSIQEVMEVLGWSYPTALEFAKENGTMLGRKWFVPKETVEARINEEARKVENMRAALASVAG